MRGLVVYLIFAALVINITPGKNYRRYISFFTGLVLIIVLMNPIRNLLALDEEGIMTYIEQILNPGEEIFDFYEVGQDGQGIDIYGMGMKEVVLERLKSCGYEACDVSVTLDKNKLPVKCVIVLSNETDEETKQHIMSAVKEVLYLEEEKISFVYLAS